ncbi:MAG TPA: translation initiation factor IF-2, partial [Ferruginibacter sp.]|nr:translation initiation factor IF-2 [Ferruginibacter sp.]
MAEVTTPRLMAAAKEFNIGKDTLVDFLVSKGFNEEDLKPTSKLTEPMYRVLQTEFQQDKVAKQKAQQIDLPKGATVGEPKKKKDEEDLSFKKKETPKETKPAEQKPVEEVKPAEPEKKAAKEEEPEVTKIKAPEIETPKVLDKIDLDSIDSSTRPKKTTKKTAKATEEKQEEEKKPAAKAKKEDQPPV